MCAEYVKQIIYTHSAQYLLNKCQLLLKLSPAVVMSQGVRERCVCVEGGAGDSGLSLLGPGHREVGCGLSRRVFWVC